MPGLAFMSRTATVAGSPVFTCSVPCCWPVAGIGVAAGSTERLDLTSHWSATSPHTVFVIAYLLVMSEEFTHLRKSKPVIIAAGLIWAVVAWGQPKSHGLNTAAGRPCATTCSSTPS